MESLFSFVGIFEKKASQMKKIFVTILILVLFLGTLLLFFMEREKDNTLFKIRKSWDESKVEIEKEFWQTHSRVFNTLLCEVRKLRTAN
jgi:hypothetical protein